MTTEIKDIDIAHADFGEMYKTNPEQTIQWINLLICDELLVSERVKFLNAVISIAEQSGRSRAEIDLGPVIDTIAQHGVLGAIRENRVTVDDLDTLTRYPKALRQAHEAIHRIPALPSTKFMGLNELIPLLLGATPDERGVRHLPDHNSYLFECELSSVAGSTSDESVGFNEYPPHLGHDEIFYADIPVDKNPHGLCRMSLFIEPHNETEPVATELIELGFENEKWLMEVPIRDLFDDGVPDEEKLFVCLTFATANNADLFTTDEVQRFVSDLPESEQKDRAKAYLEERKNG